MGYKLHNCVIDQLLSQFCMVRLGPLSETEGLRAQIAVFSLCCGLVHSYLLIFIANMIIILNILCKVFFIQMPFLFLFFLQYPSSLFFPSLSLPTFPLFTLLLLPFSFYTCSIFFLELYFFLCLPFTLINLTQSIIRNQVRGSVFLGGLLSAPKTHLYSIQNMAFL